MTFQLPVRPADIIHAVADERRRQDQKWGRSFPGRPDSFWLTILMEEVGEMAEAVLEGKEQDIEDEAIQVAAVIFAFLELRTPGAKKEIVELEGS